MQNNYQKFYDLHHQEKPFLLGNVWNVQSAKAMEMSGCNALGTSSAAIAHSLGYEDGEQITFEEYFYIIKRIKISTQLPLSVDLEAGYGKTIVEIVNNIEKLIEIGIVGINIEDSFVENGTRKMLEAEQFYERISAIISELENRNLKIFLNIRTDTYILGVENALEQTISKINCWENLKIDGIFVPCITSENEIEAVVNSTKLPVNVMCMPDLPNFETLQKLGIKRVSSGNFLNDYIYNHLETEMKTIIKEQNFNQLFHA